jgi:hypothetical protein
MGRNQRDEPSQVAIVDATATNASDQKAPINFCIDALEKVGVIVAA